MIVFLTGFMGSGKSRIARVLSQKKGWKFIDTDKEIEKREQMTVKEIFEVRGETYFRAREEKIIHEIAQIESDCVVALGGGALISEQSQKVVRSAGVLIYIKSEAEAIYQRVQHTTKRPLLQKDDVNWDKKTFLDKINDLLQIREPGYGQAQMTIHRDDLEADAVADHIIRWLDNNK